LLIRRRKSVEKRVSGRDEKGEIETSKNARNTESIGGTFDVSSTEEA